MNYKINKYFLILISCLIIFDFYIWKDIFVLKASSNVTAYFLNVDQGDSELIKFENTSKFIQNPVYLLIDAGKPNGMALRELDKIISPFNKHIDLALLTHPQLDHFGGFIEILNKYEIGAFIDNGRLGETDSYSSLKENLELKKTKRVILKEGDKIIYGNNILKILSPNQSLKNSKELNDGCLVVKLESKDFNAFFTGDIGFNVEDYLVSKYDLASDILKVPHHGSKYSSGKSFLRAVNPKISIIGVGKNTYGHPSKLTLDTIAKQGSLVFTTKEEGSIKIERIADKLKVFKLNQ